MKCLFPLAILLLGAAPAEVPTGKFQTWMSSEKVPFAFTSGGVSVHVEALPCPPPPLQGEACRYDGFNNQAVVTVGAPSLAPGQVLTDNQSAYVRVAVVRLAASDARPGVIVESQYGGSGGLMTAELLLPVRNGFRAVPLARRDQVQLEGQIADNPRDLSGDGRIDLKLEDAAFDSAFGCNACTPRPPLFFAVKNGAVADESRDPALRPVFAEEMARLRSGCFSTERYRNGACAAYVADAVRAGRLPEAWAGMLRHYERGERELWLPPRDSGTPRTFPAALRAFLIRAGYWPGRQAA